VSSSPFNLTARTPWSLVPDTTDGYVITQPGSPGPEAWDTFIRYWIYDNVGDPLTYDIDWAENVGTPQSYGSNWATFGLNTSGGTAISTTGLPVLKDWLAPPINSSAQPAPVYHQNPYGTTVLMLAPQDIYIGTSGAAAQGVWVQSDDLTYYLDQGAHTNFVIH